HVACAQGGADRCTFARTVAQVEIGRPGGRPLDAGTQQQVAEPVGDRDIVQRDLLVGQQVALRHTEAHQFPATVQTEQAAFHPQGQRPGIVHPVITADGVFGEDGSEVEVQVGGVV
ncbi:hypothetical protein RZS08_47935, partial [Arthrospira platensis SPKY1]|nr:hypothetical protein [Arthrospira platensis SPKY1]